MARFDLFSVCRSYVRGVLSAAAAFLVLFILYVMFGVGLSGLGAFVSIVFILLLLIYSILAQEDSSGDNFPYIIGEIYQLLEAYVSDGEVSELDYTAITSRLDRIISALYDDDDNSYHA